MTDVMTPDAPTSTLPPRLEGDRMVAWVRMTYQEEMLAQAKQALASQLLTELGYTPGDYLISDDAYIVSREQFNARVRTSPTEDLESRGSRVAQDAALQSPGISTQGTRPHTHALVGS
jgi:hypothetical protein